MDRNGNAVACALTMDNLFGTGRIIEQLREFTFDPDDVKFLAKPVLAHRLLLSPQAQSRGRTQEDLVAELLSTVPVPSPSRK